MTETGITIENGGEKGDLVTAIENGIDGTMIEIETETLTGARITQAAAEGAIGIMTMATGPRDEITVGTVLGPETMDIHDETGIETFFRTTLQSERTRTIIAGDLPLLLVVR